MDFKKIRNHAELLKSWSDELLKETIFVDEENEISEDVLIKEYTRRSINYIKLIKQQAEIIEDVIKSVK